MPGIDGFPAAGVANCRHVRSHSLLLVLGCLALGLWSASPAVAQQHRATRLGNPAHRFAKPLQKPEDLRALFADPKLRKDVESVLNQAQWPGDVEDLRKAAASAEIVPVKLPTGTRLPFMSTRRGGKPVALIDVLWAGKEPISAYEFEFASKGRKYRCVTPKLCANFLVVDLGPLVALEMTRSAPGEASVCEPFDLTYTVRNTGGASLTGVRILDPLPACAVPVEGVRPEALEVGALAPGEAREVRVRVRATAPGECGGTARVVSAQGAQGEAAVRTLVKAPVVTLECAAPAEVLANRPAQICLTLGNAGNAPEPRVTVSLPVPAGATVGEITSDGKVVDGRVVWEVSDLAPEARRSLCVTLVHREPGAIPVSARATGACAPPVETRCETRVAGIPAILLEVVDLEDPVEVGKPVVYEIRVTNQGTAPLTQVKLVCAVAESQEYVSGEGITPVTADGRTVTLSPLARLEPKSEVAWRVTVKAAGQADARFKVDLTSDQFARPVEEFEATSQY